MNADDIKNKISEMKTQNLELSKRWTLFENKSLNISNWLSKNETNFNISLDTVDGENEMLSELQVLLNFMYH